MVWYDMVWDKSALFTSSWGKKDGIASELWTAPYFQPGYTVPSYNTIQVHKLIISNNDT